MDSLGIALVTLACSVVGITLGGWLRRRLPDHQLRDDAKDVVKTATGMIATLVALVIGLLVSSSKSSFDGVNAGLTQAGTKFIILDAQLARYGTETAEGALPATNQPRHDSRATPARRRQVDAQRGQRRCLFEPGGCLRFDTGPRPGR